MAEASQPPSDDFDATSPEPTAATSAGQGSSIGTTTSTAGTPGGQVSATAAAVTAVPGGAVEPAAPDGPPAAGDGSPAAGDGPSATGDGAGGLPSEEDVLDALSNVIDPELGLDFVELGLIYGVEVNGGDVHVTFTLTTPACPIGPHVTEQIEEFVGELEGVTNVAAEMVFIPPWSPERMSEDAKFALGF
jgi:metal-sulfur cluster biosynthetic enzyme